MVEEPVLLIPAFNEAHNLPTILESVRDLQATRVIGHALLIDDGSVDNTAELAKKIADEKGLDLRIIRFKQNHGKGAVLYEGLRYFYRLFKNNVKGKRMVMIDADIRDATQEKISALAEPLGEKTVKTFPATKRSPAKTVEHTISMTIGTIKHGTLEFSGQRGFLLESFKPFLIRPDLRKKLIASGYGLEHFLNTRFEGFLMSNEVLRQMGARTKVVETYFIAGPATGEMDRIGRTLIDNSKMYVEMSEIGDSADNTRAKVKDYKTRRKIGITPIERKTIVKALKEQWAANKALRTKQGFVRRPRKIFIR